MSELNLTAQKQLGIINNNNNTLFVEKDYYISIWYA